MKTADLIPFILLELNDCDKYGFELTKNIEAKSGGKIVIKQPTLYTLLKKLEKSKFIASYWQDSEIGGKRHYYKLTQNGKLQVSTLPSYADLLKNALNEDVELEEVPSIPSFSHVPANETQRVSIMDELLNQQPTPQETIVPSNEVFVATSIDTSTELEVNMANTDILKEEVVSAEEKFAANADVMKFTEKTTPSTLPSPIVPSKSENDILMGEFVAPRNDLEIKHVDYVDFKNSKESKYAKKVATKKLLQILATSASIVVIATLCELLTMLVGHSPLYYTCFISAILVAVFYPVIYISKMDKFRIKYQAASYSIKLKQRLYIGLTILLAVFILCVFVSICIGKNTIAKIISVSNFANLYAPILLFSSYFLDLLYSHLILSKLNK